MVEVGKIFLVQITGMVVRKNRTVKNCCGIEEESVIGENVKILLKCKGRIGR